MSDEKNLEKNMLENVLLQSIVEQRRKRRWGIFFKLFGFILFLFFILLLFSGGQPPSQAEGDKTKSHVAVIEINGVINEKSTANATDIIKGLNQAVKAHHMKGIILHINSPGGSPVQASDIYNEIVRLRAKHKNLKIYVVCGDICASAAYYIASAADQIYANPLSLVGSIGVVMEGFGFTGAMNKVGVERRLLTAGDHKGFLDPFSPLKKEDEAYAKVLLNVVHKQFIKDVQKGRAGRLKNNPEIFSGLIWTGIQSLPLGLIDGFGSVSSVARENLKTSNVVDYTYYPGYFDLLTNQFKAFFPQELSSRFFTASPFFR
jgi:protease-4